MIYIKNARKAYDKWFYIEEYKRVNRNPTVMPARARTCLKSERRGSLMNTPIWASTCRQPAKVTVPSKRWQPVTNAWMKHKKSKEFERFSGWDRKSKKKKKRKKDWKKERNDLGDLEKIWKKQATHRRSFTLAGCCCYILKPSCAALIS